MAERCKKLRGKKRRMKNIESHVPKGMYCYGTRPDGKWVVCPFWSFDKTKDRQERGVCKAFNYRDGDNASLLWDMVKYCGVNEALDEGGL